VPVSTPAIGGDPERYPASAVYYSLLSLTILAARYFDLGRSCYPKSVNDIVKSAMRFFQINSAGTNAAVGEEQGKGQERKEISEPNSVYYVL
jgi:hypothetical protein